MRAKNNLAKIRQKSGLTVVALADQVGIKRQTIYAIEAGSYIPNTVVALKLAKAFDVSVEDLFSIEENPGVLQTLRRSRPARFKSRRKPPSSPTCSSVSG